MNDKPSKFDGGENDPLINSPQAMAALDAIENNPPAFPSTTHGAEGHLVNGPEFGMSLRDYFAGEALKSYVSLEPSKHGINATMAYAQADAMLKVRKS